MKGLRSFLVLVVLLAGLGGYVYFVESKRDPTDADAKDKVFTVEASSIDEVTIKSESGDVTTLAKGGTDWQMLKPVETKPDSAEISGLTTNLSTLTVQRVIDESPADLAEYGLDKPRVEVAFKAAGQTRTLQIGRKTPPATDLYAKLADQPRVFLIPSHLDTTFNRTTFDLRDKTVLSLARDGADALTVTTPERTIKFAKQDAEWRITEPVQARADFAAVDGLVSRLHTLQMKSIIAPEAKNLAEYGLDKPQATVQIGSGSSAATLLVGKAGEEGVVFAKDQSRPAVLTIDSALLAELKKEAGDYRQTDLFDARAFNATRIELVRDGVTTAFEKATTKNKDGQDQQTWRRVAPAAGDVDQAKVETLVGEVTQARATGFVDATAKTGLDAPALVVTIKSDEGKKEERVSFARSGDDVFAARGAEPGAATIDASVLDTILKALDDLK